MTPTIQKLLDAKNKPIVEQLKIVEEFERPQRPYQHWLVDEMPTLAFELREENSNIHHEPFRSAAKIFWNCMYLVEDALAWSSPIELVLIGLIAREMKKEKLK